MFAPGVPQVLRDFDTNNESLATFVVSVFILGFAAYVGKPHPSSNESAIPSLLTGAPSIQRTAAQ